MKKLFERIENILKSLFAKPQRIPIPLRIDD